jgi:hypothetical protein
MKEYRNSPAEASSPRLSRGALTDDPIPVQPYLVPRSVPRRTSRSAPAVAYGDALLTAFREIERTKPVAGKIFDRKPAPTNQHELVAWFEEHKHRKCMAYSAPMMTKTGDFVACDRILHGAWTMAGKIKCVECSGLKVKGRVNEIIDLFDRHIEERKSEERDRAGRNPIDDPTLGRVLRIVPQEIDERFWIHEGVSARSIKARLEKSPECYALIHSVHGAVALATGPLVTKRKSKIRSTSYPMSELPRMVLELVLQAKMDPALVKLRPVTYCRQWRKTKLPKGMKQVSTSIGISAKQLCDRAEKAGMERDGNFIHRTYGNPDVPLLAALHRDLREDHELDYRVVDGEIFDGDVKLGDVATFPPALADLYRWKIAVGDPTAQTSARELYEAYEKSARRHQREPMGRKAFSALIGKHFTMTRVRKRRERVWMGIRLVGIDRVNRVSQGKGTLRTVLPFERPPAGGLLVDCHDPDCRTSIEYGSHQHQQTNKR